MIALSIALAYMATLTASLAWRWRTPLANKALAKEFMARLCALELAAEQKTQSEGARALALAEQLMARWQPAAEDMAEMRKLVNTLALERGLKIAAKTTKTAEIPKT